MKGITPYYDIKTTVQPYNLKHNCRYLPTTPVVPSPISSSCDCESWTINFAIWWSTSICLSMVAPSFVIVTSPSGDTIILSRPLGPSDVRTMSAIALAASMWDCIDRKRFKLDTKAGHTSNLDRFFFVLYSELSGKYHYITVEGISCISALFSIQIFM